MYYCLNNPFSFFLYKKNKFIFKAINTIESNNKIYVYYDLKDLDLETLSNQKIDDSASLILENAELYKKLIDASDYSLLNDCQPIKDVQLNNEENSRIINKQSINSNQKKRKFDEQKSTDQLDNGLDDGRKKIRLENSENDKNQNSNKFFSENSTSSFDDEIDKETTKDALSEFIDSDIDSPIDLVKRSTYDLDSNDNEVTNQDSNEEEEDANFLDLHHKNNLPITPNSIINSSQSSSLANSCSNSHETIIKNTTINHSTKNDSNQTNCNSNSSNNSQNGNHRRPHPFSYHRNKTCNLRTGNMLPCDICNKAFDRPSLLKRHLRTHTGNGE